MFKQKHLGIEEYVNENFINPSNNIARIIQKNNYLYEIATSGQIIPQVKVAHKLTDEDFYVGDFDLFNLWDDDY